MNRNEGDVLGRGRYKLIKRLGKGSYGEVWLAGDTELDMNVAIKTLHPSSGSITDLQKEARTQARLNHQNIAKINNFSFPSKFAVPKLALCHLGNHCTCRRILASAELKG